MARQTLRGLRAVLLVLGLAGIVAAWFATRDDGSSAQTAPYLYPEDVAGRASDCVWRADDRPAILLTAGGVGVTVRTPRNYDPRYRHSLLVVYAPAGVGRFLSERLTHLTFAATQAGFIVAYADHATMASPVIEDLGGVPDVVARHWCIDPARVFLTGHSDGGTVATALVVASARPHQIAGIAPSAAGFAAADLAQYACPTPLPVLVMHGAADRHFPGFGRQAVEWWARCNRCDATSPERRADGCVAWRGCAPGGRTIYCESSGGHAAWPNRNATLLEFFTNAATRPM